MPPRSRGYARSLRSRRGGYKRPTTWSGFEQDITLATGGCTCIDFLGDLNVAGSSFVGLTVTRTFMRIDVQNWAAVGDNITGGLLLGRANDIGTSTAGLTAAITDLSWAWHERLMPSSMGAAVNVAQVYDFDIRAQRRLKDSSERYVICFINNSAASKTFHVSARTLCRLP
jgi:hypothetical protein